MKKVFAMLLALVMIVSLAVPAMAADTDVHSNHTITINETNPGHVFEAYQIFVGDVVVMDTDGDASTDHQATLSKAEWGTGVDTTKTVNWGTTEAPLNLTLLQALQNTTVNPTWYQGYLNDEDAADVVYTLADKPTTAHAQAFAKIVGKYLTSTYVASQAYVGNAVAPADATSVDCYKINPLHDGYYLVQEKVGNDIDPETHTEYMLKLVEDVTLTPKDGVVEVDKKIIEGDTPVDVCDNNIGDVVDFQITGSLPANYAEFTTFYYELVDIMSEGLTLQEDSVKVYTVNGDTKKEIPSSYYDLLTGTEITAADYNASKGTPTLIVKFDDLKTLTKNTEYTVLNSTKIRVEYKAVVNAKAEIGNFGNPNEVYLRYKRNPYTDGIGETEKDIVHVFTFQLDVTKIDGKLQTKLQGVKFALARERSGQKQYAIVGTDSKITGWTNWIDEAAVTKYVETTYADKIAAATDPAAWTATKVAALVAEVGVASQLTTDASGKFSVIGLDDDTYWLYETEALPGYEEIDPIKFNIVSDINSNTQQVVSVAIVLEGKAPVEGSIETGVVSTTVVNNPGQTLPETGGMGTTLFYVFGGLMVAAAIVLLVTKKRMSFES